MTVYVLVPLHGSDGKIEGREIFNYGNDTERVATGKVSIYREFPARIEEYEVWKTLIFGSEMFVITFPKPSKIEYLSE